MNVQPHVNSPSARDLAYSFHPWTNARAHEERGPAIIERAKAVHVYDNQGTGYIDALAGMWSVAVGYGEERLVTAAAEQMRRLPFYHSLSHKANHPAIDLSEKLVALSPQKLRRVFF